MSSENAVGIAPLVTGFLLAGRSLGPLARGDPSASAAAGFVGGCAAVLVGAGILLGWGEFDADANESNRSATLALAGVALCSFLVGVALVVA